MVDRKVSAAIVDYGLGNLYSVKHACEHVGMDAVVTSRSSDLFSADLVILPGVGAYGDAMDALRRLNLVDSLRDIVVSDHWLVGICLGMQLLMSESFEFGEHKGLDIIPGMVIPLEKLEKTDTVDGLLRTLKVPQVGWNQIWRSGKSWTKSPLNGLADGEYMYFVHSFYVKPVQDKLITSITRYGQIEFCSSLQYNKIFACQFHPERSGLHGLKIYKNIAGMVRETLEK